MCYCGSFGVETIILYYYLAANGSAVVIRVSPKGMGWIIADACYGGYGKVWTIVLQELFPH